jgi:hypothetical protein
MPTDEMAIAFMRQKFLEGGKEHTNQKAFWLIALYKETEVYVPYTN